MTQPCPMITTTANTATWTDGDVSIAVAYSHPETDEFGTRDAWTYTIQVDNWAVHGEHDLHSPTTGERNPSAQLAALLDFLSSDAEKYQRLMGPAPEDEDGYLFPLWLTEWAYLNEDELSMLRLELAELVNQERRTEEERVQGWIEIGQRNPWIQEAWDPPFDRESFKRCHTVDELREELARIAWCVGTAFHYRDLCLINQVEGGDEWLTIRHGIAFESITFGGYIEHGEFESLINRLLAATKDQCEQLSY